eukprot:CAMPEP_0113665610 /NCGR_PEP_ID=MMETSP0038_2-20120614/2400_1 /TAXON_ID=2898 /ORGANISM="Cryptomonas paramecium" /LENGTH=119 /DNA_ID=CAMNT_0000580981 /DNA_START=15 /DNA_END=374 /DNA_ORIENTATION=+ /assembly_acc=CAM_ASM_000170
MPILVVNTNVDLGSSDQKNALMTELSQAVAQALGKPQSYVAIQVIDKQAMMWGGSTDPCALCQVSSLGSINQSKNSAVSKKIAALFGNAPLGIPPNRIYIEFRDVPAANLGYDGATFAG